MKIVWSPLSFDRLESIHEFIVNKDPIAAKNLSLESLKKLSHYQNILKEAEKYPK